MSSIKVVFQGGGAKLVSLLAAAEILRDMEVNRGINVIRVAGVSAGAIAAAMFAGKLNTTLFRTTLFNKGGELVASFPTDLNRLKLYWNIARGNPIYPEAKLRRLLNILFIETERKLEILDDLPIPLIITASNVRNSEKVIFDSKKNPTQRLVDALVDSCALPFAFRTFKHQQLVVDGGICSNLPVDEILEYDPLVPTLAIGFEPQAPAEIGSAAGYGLALLGTAIDSATAVSISRIRSCGGRECLLPQSFGTFEFARALRDGLVGESYKELKARVQDKMEEAVGDLCSRSGALIPLADNDTAVRVHANLMARFPYSIKRASTAVYANCLAQRHEQYPAQDVSMDIVEYVADRDMIIAAKMGLAVNNSERPVINKKTFVIETNNSVPIKAEQVIMSETKQFSDGVNTIYSSLFFLDEPLTTGSDILRISQPLKQKNCMINIKNRGWDWMRGYSFNHSWPIYDHVILCPQSFGRLALSDLYGHLCEIPEKESANRLISEKDWVKGRAMTSREIAEHFPTAFPGYEVYGWRTENIPPQGYFGCYIESPR